MLQQVDGKLSVVQENRTKKIPRTRFPVWNQRMAFYPKKDSEIILDFIVMDHDQFKSGDFCKYKPMIGD